MVKRVEVKKAAYAKLCEERLANPRHVLHCARLLSRVKKMNETLASAHYAPAPIVAEGEELAKRGDAIGLECLIEHCKKMLPRTAASNTVDTQIFYDNKADHSDET